MSPVKIGETVFPIKDNSLEGYEQIFSINTLDGGHKLRVTVPNVQPKHLIGIVLRALIMYAKSQKISPWAIEEQLEMQIDILDAEGHLGDCTL